MLTALLKAPAAMGQPNPPIIGDQTITGNTSIGGNLTVGTAATTNGASPPTGDITVYRSIQFLNNADGPNAWIVSAFRSDQTNDANAGQLVLAPNGNYAGMSTRFYKNGDVAFAPDGRVSIGNVPCTPPCATRLGINNLTLAVGGKIGAREAVHVMQLGVAWPDYVFAPAYELTPLPEVERYIQTHQHLPQVPSAAEVAAEGIELASMDATLLRKVEELTLYLIALQKANEALQQRVQVLERSAR
ncbi:hypothetical protein GCM10023185_18340 [Hymenobacter saemangeumensis]|uniref:Tail fiber domain-containing protein n=1 Tax=Hymenobacter saemangeumensis TaxID=1084522 RepID=A0ABP8IC19_9BACT